VRYDNTAAKFWTGLIDEVRDAHAPCSVIELTAPTCERLERKHLFPVVTLEHDLERWSDRSARPTLQAILAELEMLGPPAPVCLRLLAGEQVLLSEVLRQGVDAEIFSNLVAWPLEWAEIPEFLWNNEFIQGRVVAEDRQTNTPYGFTFSLTNRHLSEGLYQRTVSLCL
jgi:hypothetical protein